jgi:hypothetical protein
MSKQKKKNVEPVVEETVAEEETTATETPPEAETPAAEPPKEKPSKTKTDYVCPACQHTTGVKLGLPYRIGETKFQYVQCAKCLHVDSVVQA